MTETSTPVPQPQIDLAETFALAADLENRALTLAAWVDTEVLPAWTEFLTHAISRIGLENAEGAATADRRGCYDYVLTGAGLQFSGHVYFRGESDPHEFLIPADFVDPATRPAAEARIEAMFQAEKERNEKAQTARAAERARVQREKDEAEFERLRSLLGKDD